MAEGFLKSFDSQLEVYSAGTNPSEKVDPHAIKVMKEAGIDLSNNYPKSADQFINNSFDFVITVCDNAKETCPGLSGKVGSRLHLGFEDPAEAKGTEEEIMNTFRRIRDELKHGFHEFYTNNIKNENNFITGFMETEAGPVPEVTSRLSAKDRLGTIMVRWSIARSNYKVEPGIYALGSPDKNSEVLVTANL